MPYVRPVTGIEIFAGPEHRDKVKESQPTENAGNQVGAVDRVHIMNVYENCPECPPPTAPHDSHVSPSSHTKTVCHQPGQAKRRAVPKVYLWKVFGPEPPFLKNKP